MNYELIPPTEDFFSHQWYDRLGFGTAMITDDLYSRIDSTRSKLNKLEVKLQQRLDGDRYSPDLRSFLDRVNWLRAYIGIWSCRDWHDLPGGWDVQMAYPHIKNEVATSLAMAMSRWPDELFGERKEGNILILLSPSVITWLNAVDKWVSELTVPSTTTV